MDIMEEMGLVGKGYRESVRPAIDSGDYMIAYFELDNLLSVVGERAKEIMDEVHMGRSFLASGTMLRDRLKAENPNKLDIEAVVKVFEAHYAQTTLT
jgi:hypothetical protein